MFLNSIHPLSPGLRSFLMERTKSCSFQKKELIIRAGDVCNRLYLIKKGIVRGYFLSDGMEITTWVDSENEVFTSITGFFRNEPSEENIQSLENTHCEYLEYEDYQYCLEHFSEMRLINRMLMEEYYVMAERRVYLARIPNARKRLDYFMDNNTPQLVERIPKKYLASFLSMRPETLSRLMNEKPQGQEHGPSGPFDIII